MKKVPVHLLSALNAGAENQRPEKIDFGLDSPTVEDYTYDKGHDIPEGFYIVRLVSVKYHNKRYNKLEVEVLADTAKKPFIPTQVIKGYIEKVLTLDYISACFGTGQKYDKARKYVGGVGIIHLTHSGWIECMGTAYWAEQFGLDMRVYQ